ncbi:MAG: serine/threonine-protein phosphatase [Paludibacteraceae bacterium]|nr:serine/threonine-protein phosphatase [Paludibacteraceae bacterium]
MKKEQLIFRLAARCEAAGRPNNEDNYQVDENLADDRWGFTADKEIPLGEKGALLVVCDGMGGMNAGEIASQIAVNTIKEWFDAEKLTDKVLGSSASIRHYIADAIQAADAAIKKDGKDNPEHEGMGSTIVLAWLLDKKVYVGWCGDSRIYRYNPKSGLERLSHDHSYVQELVDAGKLTEELAFDHPNNNIITRSLGDPRGKAQPDTKEYDLCNEDIIMLCSDGLCGCLRDNEIEELIKQHQTSMQECRDALWDADEAAGWHDNVTIALAQIISGGAVVTDASSVSQTMSNSKAELIRKNKILKQVLGAVIACIVLCVAGFLCWRHVGAFTTNGENPKSGDTMTIVQPTDTAIVQHPKAESSTSTQKENRREESQTKQAVSPAVNKAKDPLQQKLDLIENPSEKIPEVVVVQSPESTTVEGSVTKGEEVEVQKDIEPPVMKDNTQEGDSVITVQTK